MYDIKAAEEDDALVEVLNYGSSIHHVGFLTPEAVYALSHDETLAIYSSLSEGKPDGGSLSEGDADSKQQAQSFGDIRPVVACEYAVNVLVPPSGGGFVAGGAWLAAGNHRSVSPHPLGDIAVWSEWPHADES